MKKGKLLLLAFGLTFGLLSCKIYSFSSSNLDSRYKTFSVQNILLNAPAGPANMSQTFTEKLKEYYQRNTSLKQVSNNGHLSIEGSIVEYKTEGVTSSAGGDKAAMNRLTIVVEINFIDKIEENAGFDKEFSFYLDYPQGQTLNEAEPNLVPKILDQLVLNIFNDTAAKW